MLARLDRTLFEWLYGLGCGTWLGNVMVPVTKLSSKVFYVLYLGFIVFLLVQRDEKIIPLLLGPAAGLLFARELRRIWCRPRPFVELEIDSLVHHGADGSFPSKHSMSAFAIGMSIWYVNPSVGVWVLALAGLTGLSRVMVGVHYPSDILVGAGIGVLASVAAFNLL
ncbi:phosphatase PAP2 family protein [Dethiobacter alkaliphilus]|uniref:Phosphoesterase PA-phosphatase related protein n=1 Tax=Dethiobacter alkaliphilus AHT 1 TaxID=555088 RepID=C0GGK7_DETAL|nr:phosphatase PAP2 family protein [Dethiobacter alkaliphilus]EEG77448.1 phosphoesterase PA-phosphatase related protein [Dethiobacter alkaliphilus AHT 1]